MNKEKLPKELFQHFSQTSYGEKLMENTRFDLFRKDLSREKWVELLGNDVNNLHHMNLTSKLTNWFVNKNQSLVSELNSNDKDRKFVSLNQDQKEKLVLAAAIHDWQEAIVGDIPAPLKNQETELREQEILIQIVDEFSKIFQNPEIKVLLLEIVDQIIFNKNSLEGKIFNLIETIGYVRVALIAWQKKDEINNQDLKESLFQLSTQVVGRHFNQLQKQSEFYPALEYFLNIKRVKQSLEEINSHL